MLTALPVQSLGVPFAEDAASASEFRPRAQTEHDRKIKQKQQCIYRILSREHTVGIDKHYGKRGGSGNEIALYVFIYAFS